MKKYSFILLAAFAVCLISCNKEKATIEDPEQKQEVEEIVEPVQEVEKLVFGVSIDLGENVAPASTKATLSSLDIHWTGGEKIFIGNNINDDIEICSLTKDPSVATKGTITVTAVGGATTYYAYYNSETSTTDINFDHATATFSGAKVICRQYEFTASAPHRLDLAMAGKTTGDDLILKPCLALIKFQVHANSVAAEKVDGEGYSSVRGFNLIMSHSGSRTKCCGTYQVNLSGSSMAVSPTDDANAMDYKQVSSESRLSSSTDYYISVIPVGAVEKIDLQFLGFKWNSGTSSYDKTWGSDPKDYQMSLEQSLSIDAGDYFNFGTLNPVDLQKAKDAFVPVIDINGSMSQWDGITTGVTKDSGNYRQIKVTYDARYIFFYTKVVKSNIIWGDHNTYTYYWLDTDNDVDTGVEIPGYASHVGYEKYILVYPYQLDSETPIISTSPSASINGSSFSPACNGVIGDTFVETHVRVSRAEAGIKNGDTIRIRSYSNKSIGLTDEFTITISD